MNTDIIKGNWKELKGKVKAKWNELTDDDIEAVQGRMEELEGKIQQRYGWNKERAKREVEDFQRTLH